MGTSPITPCYDTERLETKAHVGLGSRESIEYTKHRVSLEGHPWPGCLPISDTWHPYSYGQTKQKRGLNNVGQVNPEDCYLSRKYSGLQGRDIQVVKPYKCGRQGPAGRLTNGHPAGGVRGNNDISPIINNNYSLFPEPSLIIFNKGTNNSDHVYTHTYIERLPKCLM